VEEMSEEESDTEGVDSCCICGEDDEDSIDWKKIQDGRVMFFCFPHLSKYNKGEISDADIN
jgi:hypothetical protein